MTCTVQAAADDAAPHDRITHYHCDHLGTPRELTDAQGNVIWSGRYKAWGRLLHVEGEIKQPLRFQGQYEDGETGLVYNRYRYYDSDVARYLTQDLIGLLGGINNYQYASNAIIWFDPLGLTKKCSTICCIVIIGEDQRRRVNPAAKKIGATVITDEWPKHLIYSPYIEELHEGKSIEFNRKWINEKMDQKCTIYDIGPKGAIPESKFYIMELNEIKSRNYKNIYKIRMK